MSKGDTYQTANYGQVTVIRELTSIEVKTMRRTGPRCLVQFTDGTIVNAALKSLQNKTVKNPNAPHVHGVGFIGQGAHKASINNHTTKLYVLWNGMITRCYSTIAHKRTPHIQRLHSS